MVRNVAMQHKIITGIILSLFTSMFSYPVDLKLTVQRICFAILHFVYSIVDNREIAIDCAG
jgi:hypothetical protein